MRISLSPKMKILKAQKTKEMYDSEANGFTFPVSSGRRCVFERNATGINNEIVDQKDTMTVFPKPCIFYMEIYIIKVIIDHTIFDDTETYIERNAPYREGVSEINISRSARR
jgi:hypothetical protein